MRAEPLEIGLAKRVINPLSGMVDGPIRSKFAGIWQMIDARKSE